MPQMYHLGSELPTLAQAPLQNLFAPSSLFTLTSGRHGEYTNADIDNSLLVQGSSSGLPTSLAVLVDRNNLCLPAGINLEVVCAALPPRALGGHPPNPLHPEVIELKLPTEDTISSIELNKAHSRYFFLSSCFPFLIAQQWHRPLLTQVPIETL
ncbi:hypothetical protein DSO57_1011644 [Entomophthora muscae]|uniref:Uncharacterized protein n=1 Tax=Entomophthora muscae TaxID=34485 RepID=A0ACC2RKW5_9FUNG|nr:hypothetical protein DSO57_1011644 [Entomophthora muscae]